MLPSGFLYSRKGIQKSESMKAKTLLNFPGLLVTCVSRISQFAVLRKQWRKQTSPVLHGTAVCTRKIYFKRREHLSSRRQQSPTRVPSCSQPQSCFPDLPVPVQFLQVFLWLLKSAVSPWGAGQPAMPGINAQMHPSPFTLGSWCAVPVSLGSKCSHWSLHFSSRITLQVPTPRAGSEASLHWLPSLLCLPLSLPTPLLTFPSPPA